MIIWGWQTVGKHLILGILLIQVEVKDVVVRSGDWSRMVNEDVMFFVSRMCGLTFEPTRSCSPCS